MKKNILYSALALCLGFASCTQDNTVSDSQTSGDITISVQTPMPQSRATVTVPAGYTLKCIMQLLDSNDATVGSQKTGTVDSSTGQVSFTVTGDEQTTATKALFWADYVPVTGTKVYNTDDLKAVTYNTTAFDMSDENLMAACDAYCGTLSEIADNATVTLVRPFTKIGVTPKNPEEVSGATSITVIYTAPSNYSVLTGDCSGDGTAVTYTNSSFTPASGAWFANYIFAPVSVSKLNSDITMTLGGSTQREIVIPADKLPLDANMEVSGDFTIEGVTVADITINVGVDPDWKKPEAPEMAIGSYINAQGEVVTSSDQAVGIVFQLGAIGNDVPANYPEALQGKTIKGYAVALENVSATRAANTPSSEGTSTESSVTNGTQSTAYLLTIASEDFKTAYTSWISAHTLSGSTLSDWYIPTINQLTTFIYLIYKEKEADNTNATLQAMPEFANNKLCDKSNKNANYMSSTINPSKVVSGVRINYISGSSSFEYADTFGFNTTTQSLCRPMLTIFE